ncbi:sulfite exporter TauE/SafE family protein [Actinoplanes sp. LDG1-06]|uniref:Probable membrane transporter protein n=1 Tax=Paractinoplanes ovalisporus TaxID=2810368 RepID=A0ABS2A9A9_9ACTN|nr:sulfite exporter TauE/SafE family protein [Actinoplanes ovalisporus]
MNLTVVLTVILAAGVGVSLGLLGGGGSILAVPLLVHVTGLPADEAIATSLLVVGATAGAALIPHARAGRIRWRTGMVFGPAGMAGAYAGGRVAGSVPDGVLLIGFALMMLATAAPMICGRRSEPAGRRAPLPRTIAAGIVIGAVSGLIGTGGGFLIVPALSLLGGLAVAEAIGTSLLVIALQSVAGLAGHLTNGRPPWALAAAVTVAAAAGSLLGGRLTGRVPAAALRRSFGWFVVAMGVLVLARQLAWASPLLWTIAAMATALPLACRLISVRQHPSSFSVPRLSPRRRSPAESSVAPARAVLRSSSVVHRISPRQSGWRGLLPADFALPQARARLADARPLADQIQLRLSPELVAASAARDVVGAICKEWDMEPLLAPARLVASELVTNAVEHAGTFIEFVVTRLGPLRRG